MGTIRQSSYMVAYVPGYTIIGDNKINNADFATGILEGLLRGSDMVYDRSIFTVYQTDENGRYRPVGDNPYIPKALGDRIQGELAQTDSINREKIESPLRDYGFEYKDEIDKAFEEIDKEVVLDDLKKLIDRHKQYEQERLLVLSRLSRPATSSWKDVAALVEDALREKDKETAGACSLNKIALEKIDQLRKEKSELSQSLRSLQELWLDAVGKMQDLRKLYIDGVRDGSPPMAVSKCIEILNNLWSCRK